jgi:glycosyltransferase involved in cell wall biosynthesis
MNDRPLRILQISLADILGGAEKNAWDLFQAYRQQGHESWMAVGMKKSADPDVFPFPTVPHSPWFTFCRRLYSRLQTAAERRPHSRLGRLTPYLWELAEPSKWWDRHWGLTDFRYPGTWNVLNLRPQLPDIVHCHNLHYLYFDLRALPWLSRQVPVVFLMHDAWLLSGLCCHSFDCDRWKTGCGRCPALGVWQDLDTSPHDGTAANWRRKRRIYSKSRLHVSTPSRWLMNKVEQSILAPGVAESRVIPYGIDLSIFQPTDKRSARSVMGLPQDALLMFFVAREMENNMSKDYATLRAGITIAAKRIPDRKLILLAKGGAGPPIIQGNVEIRFLPWGDNFEDVVRYYQAVDVYVHASKADTFPVSILEALACGTPVIGTAVGGIPEQVKSLDVGLGISEKTYPADTATGILVPVKDVQGMARAIEILLDNDPLSRRLGENAFHDAHQRFGLQRQSHDYLEWYRELMARADQSTQLVQV